MIGGAVLLIGGLAYFLYARNKTNKAIEAYNAEQSARLGSGTLPNEESDGSGAEQVPNVNSTLSNNPKTANVSQKIVSSNTLAKVGLSKLAFYPVKNVRSGSMMGGTEITMENNLPANIKSGSMVEVLAQDQSKRTVGKKNVKITAVTMGGKIISVNPMLPNVFENPSNNIVIRPI